MKPMRVILVMAIALGALISCGSTAVAEDAPTPYVIVGGRRIPGTSVRADRQGNITLVTPTGLLTFDIGTTVVVDEPAAFPALRRQVEEGRYAEAIPGLRQVITEYRFLSWDHRARRYLARAQVGAGSHGEALATLDELFAAQPTSRNEPVVQDTYMRALRGAGDQERLLPLLDQMISKGGRQAAAVAQVMRGNIHLEQGDPRSALFDFMRTTLLFRSVREVQPEALYRTADCFTRMGYEDKADRFYKQLQEQYPESEFAARAKGR